MHNLIDQYVRDCATCAQIKVPTRYNTTPLQPLRTSRPFEIVTMDIAGPYPHTARHNQYILVMCDHFTKWVELYAMPNQEAKTVADRIVSFACRHGIPEQILSDQGTDFQSQLVDEVFEVLDVHRLRTSPFHPQTDGLSERTIRTVKQILKAFIIDTQPKKNNGTSNWKKSCSPTIPQHTRQPKFPRSELPVVSRLAYQPTS